MERRNHHLPETATPQDWHAILGYLVASIEEFRREREREDRRPKNLISFFYPDGIKELHWGGEFDIARYYAKDLERLCLSTGLQPTELRDLFNSACIGRLEKSENAEEALYEFKGVRLSHDIYHKLLRCSGQADWEHFVAHYGTIEIDEGNFSSHLVHIPKHDPEALYRYPDTLRVNPLHRDEARIDIARDDDSSHATFTVSFWPKDRGVKRPASVIFVVPTETKEDERIMVNRISLALEQSLIFGVGRAQQSVQAIAQEFGMPQEQTAPKPEKNAIPKRTIQKPAKQEKGVVTAKAVPEKIDKPASSRGGSRQKHVRAVMPERDPEFQAAALQYWKKNYQNDPQHNAEYAKLGNGACLCIRSACIENRPSFLLAEYALKHFAKQQAPDITEEQLRSNFMESVAQYQKQSIARR